MSNNPYYAMLVNQKLAFARVLLDSARKNSDAGGIDTRVKLHGFLDGAIAQLNHALGFYVLEVADHYSIAVDSLRINQQAQNFRQIIAEYSDQSFQLSEIGAGLKDPSNWISQLTTLYMNPMALGQYFKSAAPADTSPIPAKTTASANLIQVQNLANDSAQKPSPLELVSDLSRQLQQLVDQHRAAFVED